jgi:hypothetical protein
MPHLQPLIMNKQRRTSVLRHYPQIITRSHKHSHGPIPARREDRITHALRPKDSRPFPNLDRLGGPAASDCVNEQIQRHFPGVSVGEGGEAIRPRLTEGRFAHGNDGDEGTHGPEEKISGRIVRPVVRNLENVGIQQPTHPLA